MKSDKKQTRDRDAFLKTMRDRFRAAEEGVADLHREALEDWSYRTGEGQWDPNVKAQRDQDGRPSLVINRIPEFIRQVTGQQKKQRPAIQISPVGDGADTETAEILQGVTRHIERLSNADEAYDTAFEHMATGGFGFVRILTDYVDDSFDQEIYIKREPNPFAHYPDPRCKELDYSDARYWFVLDELPKEDFEQDYPNSELCGLEGFGNLASDAPDWIKKDSVRVAEYFYIETSEETITHGERTRTKTKKTVKWCLTNGVEILDEAELPGEYIPIVPVLGEEIRVKGKRHLLGIVRNARQPQALYNLWQSAMAETIALAPKAPFTATPAQIEGFEDIWENANTNNYPYLPYNPDPKAPGAPVRNFGEPPIMAITAAIQHADNDLKTTTGLYDASLGKPGPEQSGRAILLRQQQGDTATYGFVDAMSRAIQHVGRILISWIPKIYDAPRVARIVNPDGTSKTVPVNQPFATDEGLIKIYDLTTGRYDIAVKTGPSYDSMREESAASMMALIQANPNLMQVVGDLVVSNFDWPMAKEISERLKKLLPPALQDQQNNAIPPQAQAQLAQAQQMIQQLSGALQQAQQEKQAKLLEIQSKERIAALQVRAELAQTEAKLNADKALLMIQQQYNQLSQYADNQHDLGMAGVDHAQALQQQQASTQQQAALAAQQHAQALQQAQQKAALTPAAPLAEAA
jgi:Phage P22-like portal protein